MKEQEHNDICGLVQQQKIRKKIKTFLVIDYSINHALIHHNWACTLCSDYFPLVARGKLPAINLGVPQPPSSVNHCTEAIRIWQSGCTCTCPIEGLCFTVVASS